MSTNKRITINPTLFKAGAQAKTKKARTPTETPIISPNILKNKLIGRIKEHKNREAANLETTPTNEQRPMLVDQSLFDFNNEFNNSLNYLQTISKQKKVDEEKSDYERKKQELYRKTLKNTNTFQPFVNVELHDDLKEPITKRHEMPPQPVMPPRHMNHTMRAPEHMAQQNHTSTLKLRPNNSVPYGNLKGGIKPTYREWVNKPIHTPIDNERERKLNALKEKIKQQKQIEHQKLVEQQKHLLKDVIPQEIKLPEQQIEFKQSPPQLQLQPQPQPQPQQTEEVEKPKTRLTKRTIRKQHTIGKSKIKNTVSVLLKNNTTRKNVIMAQKELKRKPINEVKTYLREHNLIKGGSNAPVYMLRELYESSMLAGQIQNNNKDTMLHNFMTTQE